MLHNRPVHNEYIKANISPYNKNLTKDEYYGHSTLLIESICEVENKYYPQRILNDFLENMMITIRIAYLKN